MTPRATPRQVGRYLLFDPLASGGMATVYLARSIGQEGFARTVAVKQLYPHFAQDPDFVTMFLDEARISSRIRHPNVVAPLDIVVDGAELFIAMEYVHGEALSTLIALSGEPVPPPIASAILMQVLLGLHAAHEATGDAGQPLDIVHRDVSPQNILVGADGAARVVDFGIAKAASRARTTQDGRLKGKLGYMAPEQIRQLETDRRVDVFTSGIVLWELLTGRTLFSGDNPAAVLQSILSCRVPPLREIVPTLSPELEFVVSSALAPEPHQRFENARAMAAALGRAVPVATALDVSAWIDALAGPQLAVRARRVAEIERISSRDVAPGVVGASLATPATGDAALPSSTQRSDAALASSTHAGGAASSTDLSITPSSTSHAVSRRRKRATLAGVGIAAAGLIGLGLLAQGRSRPQPTYREAARAPLNEPSASSGASAQPEPVVEVGAPAAISPEPAQEARPVSSTPGAPSARAREAMVTPGAPVSSPLRTAPPRSSSRAPSVRLDCRVPYFVDERGIKRFKPECF